MPQKFGICFSLRCERTKLDMQENRFELFDVSVSLICKSIQKIKSEVMHAYGLKSSHVFFIVQLEGRDEGLTATELSHAGRMDKAQISRVVSELIHKGFVARIAGEGQKYKNKLILTESGKNIARDLDYLIARALEYVSGSIPVSDLEAFYRTLFTISDNLSSLIEKPEALAPVN